MLSSRRIRRLVIWTAVLAACAISIIVFLSTRYTYGDALASFGIRKSASESQSDMNGVAAFFLARTPHGSHAAAVVASLDSLGFIRSNDLYERRSAYRVYNQTTIYAQRNYTDPLLDVVSRFFCDSPAINITFSFDTSGALSEVEATTARGCV